MSRQLIEKVESEFLKKDLPEFKAGDTVRVHVKIREGLVIKMQGGGISETFTVRKMSYGIGVERTFPLHTPNIAKIEVVTVGRVRRAKLNYIRNLSAKAARIKEKR